MKSFEEQERKRFDLQVTVQLDDLQAELQAEIKAFMMRYAKPGETMATAAFGKKFKKHRVQRIMFDS